MILIARVYKKEKMFYPCKDTDHQNKAEMADTPWRLCPCGSPDKGNVVTVPVPCHSLFGNKGSMVMELPQIMFPAWNNKKMVLKQNHWKLDCLSRGGTAALPSSVLCRDLRSSFYCSAAACPTSPPCSFQLDLRGLDWVGVTSAASLLSLASLISALPSILFFCCPFQHQWYTAVLWWEFRGMTKGTKYEGWMQTPFQSKGIWPGFSKDTP